MILKPYFWHISFTAFKTFDKVVAIWWSLIWTIPVCNSMPICCTFFRASLSIQFSVIGMNYSNNWTMQTIDLLCLVLLWVQIILVESNLFWLGHIWFGRFQMILVESHSLYICLQELRIISFSIVNMTEKSRWCQFDLGRFLAWLERFI